MNNKNEHTDTLIEGIKDGSAPDTVDTNFRYAGYLARLKTLSKTMLRYVGYTSDVAESFRRVVNPKVVTFGYGISWCYIASDVALEGWKARLRQQGLYKPGLQPWHATPVLTEEEKKKISANAPDWRLVAVKRAIFQSVATMGIPALTIHSTVKLATKAMANVKNGKLRRFGPVGLGLSVVPVLPFILDEPIEHLLDSCESTLMNVMQQK